MMGANFEQMDGIFRKQLRNYSQSVPEDIWGDIEQALVIEDINKKEWTGTEKLNKFN